MSLRSTAAPVVTWVALSKSCRPTASVTTSLAAPSASMSALPTSRVTSCACALVGEERTQRLADLTLVVGEEELHPGRVLHDPLGRRDGVEPREGGEGVLEAPLLGGLVRVALAGPEQRDAGHAGRGVLGDLALGGHRDEALRELERRLRRDDRQHAVVRHHLGLDGVPGGQVGRCEQVDDGRALVHREEGEHRLAAEEVLVLDVVLVDLLALVEVAVLPRGELELAQPDAEHGGDDEDDHPHEGGALAEGDGHRGPELVHGSSSVRGAGGQPREAATRR